MNRGSRRLVLRWVCAGGVVALCLVSIGGMVVRARYVRNNAGAGDTGGSGWMRRIGYFLEDILPDSPFPAPVRTKPDGWTPLHEAAFRGDAAAVKSLLAGGATVDAFARGNLGNEFWEDENRQVTPLAVAVFQDHTDVAVQLVQAGAKLPLAKAEGLPLLTASGKGNVALTRLLLTHGADVHQRDYNGNTALHRATNEEVAALLLQNGASVADMNRAGQTPLHTAKTIGIANLLLAHGADINRLDRDGQTPLVNAAGGKPLSGDEHLDVARMLVARGADVNAVAGTSALSGAIETNDPELVHRLLDRGATIAPTDLLRAAHNGILDTGESDGLGVWANRGPTTIARLLLERGADANVQDDKGQTPLIVASLNGDDLMLPLLLAHGANINAQDKDGCTALHWAAGNGQTRVVRFLLVHSANPALRDTEGKTALDVARVAALTPERFPQKPNYLDLLSAPPAHKVAGRKP